MTTCYNLVQDDRINYVKLCVDQTDAITFSGEQEGGSTDLDFVWILICGFLVMLMQLGFTLLEAGAVRYKNSLNIMFKNFADFCLGALVWYFFGWAITAAPDDEWTNEFMGSGDATLSSSKDYLNWFFSMVFAATAATIVSGAVAERATLQAYLCYSFVITAWIYPIVVYWVWSGSGVFSPGMEFQMIDFAGSGVVHMVGGFSGLMGAILIGPRKGKVVPHSVALQVMGVFLLFFGWFGFNCGSTLSAQGTMQTAARVAATTTLSASTSGLSSVALSRVFEGVLSVERMGNGILAGLVGITAGCHVVEPWGAILIGLISSLVYYGASRSLVCLGVDDPLDAAAVHGFCGFWGVLACAIFGSNEFITEGGYLYENELQSTGRIFLNQFVGAFTIMVWTCGNAGLMFGILKLTNQLRVDDEMEKSGLNIKHSTRLGEDAGPWHFRKASIDNHEGGPGTVMEMGKRSLDGEMSRDADGDEFPEDQ